jgi:hypothetical protein
MTVAELIIELRKLDQSMEVWIDTNEGLMALNGLYAVPGDVETAILTYKENEYDQ